MPGDFGEVLSKFQWARRQIALLDIALADYINLEPYMAEVADQPEAQAYKVVARLRYPPPPALSHIVGDVLNSLHGTLDYLAWQLALRENGVPDLRTAFPIVKSPNEDGSEPPVNIYRSGDGGRGTFPLIKDPEVITRLRDIQPYRLPEDERHLSVLLLLRTLNGEGKHRHPTVVTSAIDQGHYAYSMGGVAFPDIPPDAKVGLITTNFTPRKDGDELAWVPYSWIEGRPPEHTDFTTLVTLEEAPVYPRTGEPFPVNACLTNIAMWIENNVLARFCDLF
jgi:hypothetical protein